MTMPKLNIQLYENYDRVIVDLVHQNLIWSPDDVRPPRPVVCVFASPERAYAQVWKRMNLTEDDVLKRQKVTPLPFIAINRISEEDDPSRANVARMIRLSWDVDRTVYFGMDWPIPKLVLYEMTIYTRNQRDQDWLVQQMSTTFPPGGYKPLLIDHPMPMGQKRCSVRISEDRRQPTITAPDKQRTLLRTLTMEVTGWLVRPKKEYPVVERVITTVEQTPDDELSRGGEVLDQFTTAVEEV
ncbi:MAG: hypothetical protein M0P55_14710 [Clostridiales bacterium]|nr:hypothetical protein [Clostridiales bacterium]